MDAYDDSTFAKGYPAMDNDDDMHDSDSQSDDDTGAPQSADPLHREDSIPERAQSSGNASNGNYPSPQNGQGHNASQQASHGLNPRSCVTCRKRKVCCGHPRCRIAM